MDSPRIDALVERVQRLERENSRLKWAGIVSILALGTLTTTGAVRRGDETGVIRVGGFFVAKETGRVVVRISAAEKENGRGLIEFLDKNGKPSMAMGLGKDDSPFILLADTEGQEQLVIDAIPKKGIGITFRNLKRDSGLLLGINPEGVAALGMVAEGGKHTLDMGVNPDGSTRLKLRDKDGRIVFKAPVP